MSLQRKVHRKPHGCTDDARLLTRLSKNNEKKGGGKTGGVTSPKCGAQGRAGRLRPHCCDKEKGRRLTTSHLFHVTRTCKEGCSLMLECKPYADRACNARRRCWRGGEVVQYKELYMRKRWQRAVPLGHEGYRHKAKNVRVNSKTSVS